MWYKSVEAAADGGVATRTERGGRVGESDCGRVEVEATGGAAAGLGWSAAVTLGFDTKAVSCRDPDSATAMTGRCLASLASFFAANEFTPPFAADFESFAIGDVAAEAAVGLRRRVETAFMRPAVEVDEEDGSAAADDGSARAARRRSDERRLLPFCCDGAASPSYHTQARKSVRDAIPTLEQRRTFPFAGCVVPPFVPDLAVPRSSRTIASSLSTSAPPP